jgi:CNT family concentrative nucleoside transporter
VTSKLLLPENDSPRTLRLTVEPHYERETSIFEAIINGANAGLKLIFGIAAMLLAILGLVALLNLVLGGIGDWINEWLGFSTDWSLEGLLGYLFYPITILLGVPPHDAGVASRIIGERMVVTELTAYQHLNLALEQGLLHDPRSVVIVTYALCGFAHFASLAIFVGGAAALVPGRTSELAGVGLRALVAATFACLLTACVAGAFFSGNSLLLGG